MAVVNFITAVQLGFPNLPKEEAQALRANLDSAGQSVFNQNNGAAYEVAKEKFKALLDPVNPQAVQDASIDTVAKALLQYNKRILVSKVNTATGTMPKEQLKVYFSLVRTLQPDEVSLTAKGLSQGLAKTIGDYCDQSKAAIEKGLTQLQLGAPYTDAELQQKLPAFVKFFSRGQGPGAVQHG